MSADESPRGSALVRFVVQFWAPFVLVGLAAVFIGRFLWLTVESPMWLLLAAMLLVGVAVGLLLRRRRR
jgi:LPXTG-motif cell wall-anchored protein